MSGSIRLTGPTSGMGIGLTNVRRTGGAYVDLDFAKGYYERGGVVRKNLTDVSGYSFTRASLATMFDATGKLTYGPNNLCLYSQDLSNAAWLNNNAGSGAAVTRTANYAAAPDGTMTATRLQCSLGGGVTTGSFSFIYQAVSPVGANRVWSLWLKTNDGSTKAVYYRSGNTETTLTVTGTWTRFVLAAPAEAGTTTGVGLRGGQTVPCSDTVDLLAWGAQLEAVTYQTTPSTYYPTTSAAYYGARLVYDPVTLASLGILVEEARTNSILQSQDFATSWTASAGTSVSTNATTDPAGTSTADKLVKLGSASTYSLYQSLATSAGAYTVSIYAKPSGYSWLGLGFGAGAQVDGAFFNVTTGAVGTVAASSTARITALPNGWYRCEVTRTLSAGTNYHQAEVHSADNQGNWTGDGTSGIYLWQAQLEAGVGASSAIVTTSAAVTRAADVPIETTALTYPLTIVTEFIRNWDAGAAQIVCQVDAGSDAQRAYASIDSSDLFAGTTSGSGASTVAGATVVGTSYKGAVRVATNDVQTARGGTLGTGDTSASNPTDPTRIVIGGANSAGSPLNGTISRIRIYKSALSDAQLQSLTS